MTEEQLRRIVFDGLIATGYSFLGAGAINSSYEKILEEAKKAGLIQEEPARHEDYCDPNGPEGCIC